MTFAQSVRSALSKYATFAGRARRSEFWWFYLFTVLVSVVTSIIDLALSTVVYEVGIVGTLAGLALLLPSLAVTARRLHDTGRSGWWILLPAVPLVATVVLAVLTLSATAVTDGAEAATLAMLMFVGLLIAVAASIVLIVFLCLDSNPGPNAYGPPPKQPPMPPFGPGGYSSWPAGYGPQQPAPGYGPPYGYPQQPPPPP